MHRRAFIGGSLVLLWGSTAQARKQRELAYRADQVWNAALRMIRVDLQMPVTDRDQQGGYVLFDYLSSNKRYPGSLELVPQTKGVRPSTVVIAQVRGMPSYVEQMLIDKLENKLFEEVGAPPPEPPKEKEPPKLPASPPDAGTP